MGIGLCHNISVYERYSEPARYTVFYANWYARVAETDYIDSIYLLKALMYKEEFRSNTLFHLREHFPLRCNCPCKFSRSEDVPRRDTPLTNDVKRILAYTAQEADRLGDHWIQTEHFVLGILNERGCPAAEYLTRTGLTLSEARRIVRESRPRDDKTQPPAKDPPEKLSEKPPYSILGKLISKWRRRRS